MADTTQGWVKLFRSIQNHQLWTQKPFSKGQAWIDLILMANHKDGNVMMGNDLIEVKRGQLLTSQIKLSQRWGWSRGKVRRLLWAFSTCSMVELKPHIQKDRGYTLISIINYNNLQDIPDTKRTSKWTSNGQVTDKQRYTNKNVRMEECNKKDTYMEPSLKNKVGKGKYAKEQNVRLTTEEYGKLLAQFGCAGAEDYIERLSLYIASKGDKYKSHYHTILNWDRMRPQGRLPSPRNAGIPTKIGTTAKELLEQFKKD